MTLENTYWKLVEINSKPVTTPEGGREVYMMLTRENESRALKGHAGCNSLGGDYELDGNKIKFQTITTRMYCELQMEVENQFTSMLTAADRYRLRDSELELLADDQVLGKFKAVPEI